MDIHHHYSGHDFNTMSNCSPYLKQQLARFPELAVYIQHHPYINIPQVAAHCQAAYADMDLPDILRMMRKYILCYLMTQELQDQTCFSEVVDMMSEFAKYAIQILLDSHYQKLIERYGQPRNVDHSIVNFVVFGMGKLGGRELNVSSDVDLVFLFEGAQNSDTCQITHGEFFEKLGQKLIQSLHHLNHLGFVFRVDMRLRPYGDIGSIVTHADMFEEYLLTQGRAWERFAWLKARQIYGQASVSIAKMIQSFVYRRYLDYALMPSLRDVHAQIMRQYHKYQYHHIKLGRGGIREIEFFIQIHQLLYGGQRPQLQKTATLDALDLLQQERILDDATIHLLRTHYVTFRNIEHALQYLDDAHRHHLPSSADHPEWQSIAAFMHQNIADLQANIAQAQTDIHQLFKSLFDETPPAIDTFDIEDFDVDGSLYTWLHKQHFDTASQIVMHIQHELHSARYRVLSQSAQKEFKQLLSLMLTHCAQQKNAQLSFMRGLDFLHTISQRKAYVSLLVEYPHVMHRVIEVLTHSLWAANYLIQHPYVIDELLQNQANHFDDVFFRAQLKRQLAYAEDTEAQMDILRQHYHTEAFRILWQEIHYKVDILLSADKLSALTDAVLDATLHTIWQGIDAHHPLNFAVIAYGKLGGKELGYASDLDIIFLYDDDDEHLQTYVTLARKMTTWLSSTTRAGKLFDIDTRLRPNGQAGILVSSLHAFCNYELQKAANSAWTWEHQALSRARFCAGSPKIGLAFDDVRQQVLTQARDITHLAKEIASMRDKMAHEKSLAPNMFSVKYSLGGMVDIEFIVQFHVLAYAGQHAILVENLGNVKLLQYVAQLGFLSKEVSEQLQKAYIFYRKVQYKMRLNEQKAVVDLQKTAATDDLWAHIAAVKQAWQMIFNREA